MYPAGREDCRPCRSPLWGEPAGTLPPRGERPTRLLCNLILGDSDGDENLPKSLDLGPRLSGTGSTLDSIEMLKSSLVHSLDGDSCLLRSHGGGGAAFLLVAGVSLPYLFTSFRGKRESLPWVIRPCRPPLQRSGSRKGPTIRWGTPPP